MQFAEGIGVNTKELLFVQPDYAEMALDTVDQFVRSTGIDVIVVDSVIPVLFLPITFYVCSSFGFVIPAIWI